jgi:hypothetical protein
MERDSLVAINITNNENKLLNKTSMPMLFYWNGESDVLDDLSKDENLIEYTKNLITNPADYLNIFVSYFYFKYNENNEEDYSDNTLQIQDLILLEKFESDHIVLYFLKKLFLTLYKISFKMDFPEEGNNASDDIKKMCYAIKEKFKTRLTKETIINWVRSALLEKDHLNTQNTEYIILKLNQIINFEE